MRIRLAPFAFPVLGLLALAACASTEPGTQSPPAAPAGAPATEPAAPAGAAKAPATKADEPDLAAAAAKVAAAERALALARAKLEKSRTDLHNQETAAAESMAAAETEHELSKRALTNFETTSRLRLEREKLSLQGAMDNVAEAEEEMQQLELMYEKNDLADKTKELVIRRGQRRLERSRRSLELRKAAIANTENIDLAQERAKLQHDLETKARALARAKREAASGIADKTLAAQGQENDVARLEDELAAARRAADKAQTAKGK